MSRPDVYLVWARPSVHASKEQTWRDAVRISGREKQVDESVTNMPFFRAARLGCFFYNLHRPARLDVS